MNNSMVERFWGHVRIIDGCWEWTGSKNKWGYGKFYRDRKTIPAHRAAYEIAFGPIPDGLWIRHKCDNPSCVNPSHLESGTPTDNNRDTVTRGRRNDARGQDAGHTKLTDSQVLSIRSDTRTVYGLAEENSVSPSTISRVINGRGWAHVGGPTGSRRNKLGRDEVRAMRWIREVTYAPYYVLGAKYGVSPSQACNICMGVSRPEFGGPIAVSSRGRQGARVVRSSKLTVSQVRAIRSDPRPDDEVASVYGVSASNVWMIRQRKTWKHV